MKDRRKGERRSFNCKYAFRGFERRETIIKAGRRENTKDRRSMERNEDNYFRLGNEERRKK